MATRTRRAEDQPPPTEIPPGGLPAEEDQDQRSDAELAAERRAAAMAGVPAEHRGMVDALLVERRGYVQRAGMADRVSAVNEQLTLRGYNLAAE